MTWKTLNIEVKMKIMCDKHGKNPSKKTKKEKIQRSLIVTMATHDALAKNFIESNLKKKNNNIAFPNTYDFGSKCDE